MYFVGMQCICTVVNIIIYIDDKKNRGGVLAKASAQNEEGGRVGTGEEEGQIVFSEGVDQILLSEVSEDE